MRKIVAITGIRSEYGNLRPVFFAIEKQKDLNLQLVVCGAHLSKKFGHTIDEIYRDGFSIYRTINNLGANGDLIGRVESIAGLIPDFSRAILTSKADLILAFGDREESLCAAIACNYLNIPLAHISGGDNVWGNSDDMVRHAISKMAHIHFVTNKDSERRLLKMGEQSWRIFNVGLPAVDVIAKKQFTQKSEIAKKFHLDLSKPTIVVLNNPLSSQLKESVNQIDTILKILCNLDCNIIVIYPNSDPGSQKIISKLDRWAKIKSQIKLMPTLHQYDYFGLLSFASCMIGNSSSGLLESAYFGLPVVNVGNRGEGRLHAKNVHFVSSRAHEIKKEIFLCLFDKTRKKEARNAKKIYGNGHASDRITNIIKKIPINLKLLVKKNTY